MQSDWDNCGILSILVYLQGLFIDNIYKKMCRQKPHTQNPEIVNIKTTNNHESKRANKRDKHNYKQKTTQPNNIRASKYIYLGDKTEGILYSDKLRDRYQWWHKKKQAKSWHTRTDNISKYMFCALDHGKQMYKMAFEYLNCILASLCLPWLQ